jgi:hypothetical protein
MPKPVNLEEAGALVGYDVAVLPAPPGVLLDLDVLVSEPPEPEGCVTLIYRPQPGANPAAPSCITVVQGPGEYSLADYSPAIEILGETQVQVAVDPPESGHANVMTAWQAGGRGFGLSAEWFTSPNADEEMRATALRLVTSLIEANRG